MIHMTPSGPAGHQHATFRWVLSDLVTCDFSIEHLDSIFYSGHDLTTYVRGNDSDPSQAGGPALEAAELGAEETSAFGRVGA